MVRGTHLLTSLIVNEESRTPPWETARRVLLAVVVEANGRPGAYVFLEHVMQQANMVDAKHFRTIARYLEEQRWIADAEWWCVPTQPRIVQRRCGAGTGTRYGAPSAEALATQTSLSWVSRCSVSRRR